MKKFFGRLLIPFLSVTFMAAFFVIILLPFYQDGKMIMGGEGSYYNDFLFLLKNYGYLWYNTGAGSFAVHLNYVFHLALIQKLVGDPRIVNFVMIFLLYFLPFLAVYLASLELKAGYLVSFLVAIFYVVNPFMSNFLKSINQWNMLAPYMLASFFLIILRYFNNHKKLFIIFGLNSLFFAFTNANAPTMVLYQMAIPFFLVLTIFFKEQKFSVSIFVKKYLLILLSFLLFNIWWIVNWFYIFSDATKSYSKQTAVSWLRGASGFIPAFWRTLTLTNLLPFPIDPSYDYFSKHFGSFFVPLILLIPILLLLYFFFRKGLNKKLYLILGLTLISVGFLAKGTDGLFGGVYEFMVMNIPLFNIFKSAGEKWGLVFVFLLTLFLVFALKELKKDRHYRYILASFLIYLAYCSVPFATGNFLPDYNFKDKIIGSKRFLDKPEYQNLRNNLNSDPLQYRVLSLPGSNNYQVALWLGGKKFYTGNDPVLSNTNKPFIAPYTGAPLQNFNSLFDSLKNSSYQNILGLFNIKKIVVNNDAYPWFDFRENMTISQTEEYLNKKFSVQRNDSIDLYDTSDFFLPRFYVPEDIIYASGLAKNDLWIPASDDTYRIRSAIYLDKDNQDSVKEQTTKHYIVGESQAAFDKQQLREGNAQLNQAGVLFPYARWRPGGFIYKYVLKKENQVMAEVSGQDELLFEKNLFYAAKRISEIEKWDEDFSDEEFAGILDRYHTAMSAAVDILEKFSKERKDAFPFLEKSEVSFAAHEKRLTDVLRGDFGEENNQRLDEAEKIFLELDGRLDEIITSGFSRQRYLFKVSEEGDYEILVEKNKIPENWRLEKINLKEGELFDSELTGKSTLENWKSFGKFYFQEGEHYFQSSGSGKNLLNTKFSGLENAAEMSLNGISFSFSKDPIFQKISNWKSVTSYKLTFKYKGNGSLRVTLNEYLKEVDETWFNRGVEQKPVGVNFALKKDLEIDNGWKGYSKIIKSSFKVDSAFIFFSSLSPSSSFMIKDLKIEEIVQPIIVLKQPLAVDASVGMPKITFKKINPTKYIVDVTDVSSDYLLVFSESFHRGWKAYVDTVLTVADNQPIAETYFDGDIKEVKAADNFFDKDILQTINKKPISEDRHILINGYANSWLINREDANHNDSYTIIIEYWPQKLFYAGAIVTTMAILICLVSFLIGLKKTNDKKTLIS